MSLIAIIKTRISDSLLGGYVPVSSDFLFSAIRDQQHDVISKNTLNVFFALLEFDAIRRNTLDMPVIDIASHSKFQSLLGNMRPREIISHLQLLIDVGVLIIDENNRVNWSCARLMKSRNPPKISQHIGQSIITLPRRLVRYLARTKNRSVMLTALFVVGRCLYQKPGVGFRTVGKLGLEHVIEFLGVGKTQVYAALKHLMGIGFVKRLCGGYYEVSADWSPPQIVEKPNSSKRTNPKKTQKTELLRPQSHIHDLKNQELAEATEGPAKSKPKPMTKSPDEDPKPKMVGFSDGQSIGTVIRDHLVKPEATEQLYNRACSVGLAKPTDAGRLEFYALAKHCVRVATQSAEGMFASLLRRQNFAFVTQADENAARLVLLGKTQSDKPKKQVVIKPDVKPPVVSHMTREESVAQVESSLAKHSFLRNMMLRMMNNS